MKKYLKDFTTKNKLRLINENDGVKNILSDIQEENVMFWIDEKLYHIKSSLFDYSIGFYNYNYIKVNEDKKEQFLQGMIDLVKDYSGSYKLIEATERAEKLMKTTSNNEEEYQEHLNSLTNELKALFLEDIENELNYSFSDQESLDDLENWQDSGNYYIIDNDYKKLYFNKIEVIK